MPFTRNQIGSMDYTPMAFHRSSRPTSDAHELALSVLFESGLQNLAGTPESYDARPEAVRFLEQVPSVWDETKLLSGRPGDHVVMARRSGDRWFLGAGVSGAARTVDIPLSFVHGKWLVEIVRDGPSGLVRESHVVTAPRAQLSIDVVAEGGFAGIACRWLPGRTTCDEPVDAVDVPETTLAVAPGQADVRARAGGSFEVTGTFTVDSDSDVGAADVRLLPSPPEGWRVDGEPAEAAALSPGDSVTGTWMVSAPSGTALDSTETVDVPVVATYRADSSSPDGPVFEEEQAVRVDVLPPGTLTLTPDTVQVAPGDKFDLTVQLRVADTEPLTSVSLAPRAPEGWSVQGDTAEAAQLAPGETLTGTWELTAPADADGPVEIPVVASYATGHDQPGDPPYEQRTVVKATVARPNLALGKPVAQSSLGFGGVPERAVDGNTNGAWSSGTVTHTDFQDQPWWQVDLGGSHQVDEIVIWGRTDSCCADRLSDYYVLVSDRPFVSGSLQEVLAQPGVWSHHQQSPPTPSLTVHAGGVSGRYVRVQLAGNNALSLAEVQVYAGVS